MMKLKLHNPVDAMVPVGAYSLGVESPAGARFLHLSGQVGTDAQGQTGKTYVEQMKIIYDNCHAILRSAGMTPQDVVKVTSFIIRTVERSDEERKQVGELWKAFFGDHRPASTLIFIDRLVGPEWLVEVEMIAAKKD